MEARGVSVNLELFFFFLSQLSVSGGVGGQVGYGWQAGLPYRM